MTITCRQPLESDSSFVDSILTRYGEFFDGDDIHVIAQSDGVYVAFGQCCNDGTVPQIMLAVGVKRSTEIIVAIAEEMLQYVDRLYIELDAVKGNGDFTREELEACGFTIELDQNSMNGDSCSPLM